jgi:hypothetical protein
MRIAVGSGDGTVKVFVRASEEQVAAWQEEERRADERLSALALERGRKEPQAP